MDKDYRSRRHCFHCGRGLSQKYRIGPETALMLAIFNKGIACTDCAKKIGEKIKS